MLTIGNSCFIHFFRLLYPPGTLERVTLLDGAEYENGLQFFAEADTEPAYDFYQEEGDMVYIPAGGWFHVVLNLEDSTAVSGNMINRLNYPLVTKAFCVHGLENHKAADGAVHGGAKACNVLRELRPAWYETSCCPRFLAELGALTAHGRGEKRFPVAQYMQRKFNIPRSHWNDTYRAHKWRF